MRFRSIKAFAVLAVSALLAACGTTFVERAYKTGEAYNIAQDAANDYREFAKPSLEVDTKIHHAMMKASVEVKNLLACASELVAAEETPPEVPADAAALGLDSGDVVEAKEEACEGLLSRANKVIDQFNQTVDES
jgi:hypothetical protein